MRPCSTLELRDYGIASVNLEVAVKNAVRQLPLSGGGEMWRERRKELSILASKSPATFRLGAAQYFQQ